MATQRKRQLNFLQKYFDAALDLEEGQGIRIIAQTQKELNANRMFFFRQRAAFERTNGFAPIEIKTSAIGDSYAIDIIRVAETSTEVKAYLLDKDGTVIKDASKTIKEPKLIPDTAQPFEPGSNDEFEEWMKKAGVGEQQ